MSLRSYTFTIASGATGSNILAIAPHSKMMLLLQNSSTFMPSAIATTLTVRGSLSSSTTQADINGYSFVNIYNSRCWVFPNIGMGMPYMSIGIPAAATGTSSNKITMITYSEVGD